MPGSFIIPMSRATGLGSLPELLEERASTRALHRAFDAEDIPLSVIENRKIPIPVSSMVGIFDRAAAAVGDRMFGLDVGQAMAPVRFGLWMEYSTSASTLGQALKRAIKTARFHQSGGTMTLECVGAYTVWRHVLPDLADESGQYSDHIIGAMIRFLSAYLGSDWSPSWVELKYQQDLSAGELERRLEALILFGRASNGVAFPSTCLQSVRRQHPSQVKPRALTLLDVEASDVIASNPEPIQSILAIVSLRLLDGLSDIDGAARKAGLGVQTLQRTLRQQGLTYRQVLELAVSARSKSLLRDTKLSVTQIALDLGYADHANFTRAFGRWTGCSPREFRKRAPSASD